MSKQELKRLLLELLEDFDVRYKLNHNYPCQKTTTNKNSIDKTRKWGRLENKEINVKEFVVKFWQLHDSNIELIMEYEITKNLPQIVSLDDLDRIQIKDTEDAYVTTLSKYMQENSESHVILSDLLQNSNKVVREIKTEFLIRFLMKLHPEFFN